jgi:hypothetical protein
MDWLKRIPFHPVLFGAYPVLALLAWNIGQIKESAAFRVLPVSIMLAVVLLLVLRGLLRDWQRAALASTLVILLFYSYGHVYSFLERVRIFGLAFGRHRFLLPFWILMMVIGIWAVVKARRELSSVTAALNVIAIVVVVFPLFQLLSFRLRSISTARAEAGQVSSDLLDLHVPPGQTPPDVYYIILDGYPREDVLRQDINFDNSRFLDKLEELGFYVARCSQSNYAITELSLPSSLNFDYIDLEEQGLSEKSADRSSLWPLLRYNKARQAFQHMGYTVVAFETGFNWSELEDADVYVSRRSTLLSGAMAQGVNNFEGLVINTTMGLALADARLSMPGFLKLDTETSWEKQHRDRILYVLDQLPEIATSVPGPKFVFAHILAPHQPYVLGANGEEVLYPRPLPPEIYKEANRNQIVYLNKRVGVLLEEILRNSPTPPIIIVQGDHSHKTASPRHRVAVLNAYYLPGEGAEALYPKISPVNSFRVIFDTYFGGQFGLLEDQSYYSDYDFPFKMQNIPYDWADCAQE